MKKIHSGKFSKTSKFFIVFAAIYIIYNVLEAAKINFESSLFLPFRYEGLLFFKNAISEKSGGFFFIRDWSTSFLPQEHPLLYFHNLDIAHFFAGAIQYYIHNGKMALFLISLTICISVLWKVWIKLFNNYFGNFVSISLFALIILPITTFRIAPQNLFITIGIALVCWHAIILRAMCDNSNKKTKIYLQLFLLFLVASAVETNLAILLVFITVFFALYTTESCSKLDYVKKNALILLVVTSPVIIFRIVQLISVLNFGYLDKYLLDINYTRMLKVNSNIDTIQSIAFYAKHGITFFGQGNSPNILNNIRLLTNYYFNSYGRCAWTFTLIVCLAFLIVNKLKFARDRVKNNTSFCNLTFFSLYFLSFALASYLILLLSGDAIIKVYLSKYGIIDITILYRAFFIVFIPIVLYEFFKENFSTSKTAGKFFYYALILISTLFFLHAAKNSLSQTRKEYFGYRNVLSLIPKNSDVITNFEPSVIAIETESRANMSWFESLPQSCNYLNSKTLLKMYKVNKEKYSNSNLYVFLALYPPYGGEGKDSLVKRHCIKPQTHKLLFEDSNYLLYKYLAQSN